MFLSLRACRPRELQILAAGHWAGFPLTSALFLQADLCIMTRLLGYVNPLDPSFVAAVLTITFNPLFWNVVSALLLALSRSDARRPLALEMPAQPLIEWLT